MEIWKQMWVGIFSEHSVCHWDKPLISEIDGIGSSGECAVKICIIWYVHEYSIPCNAMGDKLF